VVHSERSEFRSLRCGAIHFFSAIFALVLGSCLAMNTQANDADSFPPVAPENESSAPANSDFVNMCLTNSAQMVAKGGWKLGKQLLTQSSTWGTIWRADFKSPGNNSTLVNRVICWQQPGEKFKVMFAIGQDVPPL
jgi:hypothetical protein